MKKELNGLLKLSKKIVKKETYKKLKKIRDKNEAILAVRYTLISSLEQEYHAILEKINVLENESKDVFFIKNKSIIIPSKIKHFKVNFHEEEFYKLLSLLKNIKKEIRNV